MLKFFSAPAYALVAALALALATPQAEARTFPSLAGKYVGVLIISQGTQTRILGNANVIAKASGLIIVKGTINSVAFTQKIRLGPGTQATVSTLLPGISTFNQTLIGRFSGSGSVTVSGNFESTQKGGGSQPGTLKMKIAKITFGSTISLQTIVTLKGGADPIFVTITAS